jgi:hypothetical protein
MAALALLLFAVVLACFFSVVSTLGKKNKRIPDGTQPLPGPKG